MKTRPFFFLFCLLLLAVFIWSVLQVLQLRFARGDVYPAYSSLRSDPLGAKAFYESLARLESIEVSRNQESLGQFAAEKGTTLLYMGASDLFLPEKTAENLERFVKAGSRLVIAFFPQGKNSFAIERDDKKAASPSPSPSPDQELPVEKFFSTRDLAQRWDFKLQTNAKLVDHETKAKAEAVPGIDPEISWHSALHFKEPGPAWKNIYTASGFPVVIERQLGGGSIVLASDSYFMSNEALRRERRAGFLAWLIGSHDHVVFDETHLGIRENPGVSTLMRRYHLGGLIAGLILVGFLAVWKNAARLIPAIENKTAADEVLTGKDSFGGLVNLLRRNIAPQDLLTVSVTEWSKFLPHRNTRSQKQRERAEEILQANSGSRDRPREAVRLYQEISQSIKDRKWKQHN